jgi:hypothetical protein
VCVRVDIWPATTALVLASHQPFCCEQWVTAVASSTEPRTCLHACLKMWHKSRPWLSSTSEVQSLSLSLCCLLSMSVLCSAGRTVSDLRSEGDGKLIADCR